MANVVIVGAQWGDEGKGKIVDWLCEKADVVVRFQGGHNAGHTLVIDGNIYKLSLLPSGLVRGKLSIIGNGVVIDPHALLREIDIVSSQGVEITPERLKIADNASLILSLHRELDALREAQARGTRIGTTKSGIGPAYEDKVGRRAIRMCDLTNLNSLPEKIDRLLSHHNPLRAGLGQPLLSADKLYEELAVTAESVTSYMAKIWQELDQQWRDGRRILFEGAQGAMLDIDYGTYPFVTSSNTLAGQVACGSGVGPHMINKVLGIVKAYSTRVGAGPFPTEQENEIGQRLGERGKEFGTVTGRRRRCGWFDAVLARQSVVVNGISAIALTKLDVLDGLDELMVCTAYELDGVQLDTLPTTQEAQARVKPVYKSFAGWRQSTRGARRWADLPAEAIKYIRQIEELVGAPVALLSTSPERDDTILVSDPFIN